MSRSAYSPRDWHSHPPYLSPDYKSTRLRAPSRAPLPLPDAVDPRGPGFARDTIQALDHDLLRNGAQGGEPLGERIIVTGRVLDDAARPLADTLIEIWQANAAGRYIHQADDHPAPLDANFYGAGRTLSDAQGRYRFYTVKPGAYPWGNHANAWRPAHIHFSLIGPGIATRLVTQMYFPGDPLLAYDPIFLATPAHARERLIATFSLNHTEAGYALGYVFDIVLRGSAQTPLEQAR